MKSMCGKDCFTNATTTVLLPIVSTAQVSVLVSAKEFGNGLSHDFACNCLYLVRNRLQHKLRHSKQDVVGLVDGSRQGDGKIYKYSLDS